jgi:hypothetical protein
MIRRLLKSVTLVVAAGALLQAHRRPPVTIDRDTENPDQVRAGRGSPSRQRLAWLRKRARAVPRFVVTTAQRSFPGVPPHGPGTPDLLFAWEPRDPDWAPAMESAMARTFFAPGVLSRLGLEELRSTGVTCRQTTCRMDYEYPSKLVSRVTAAGLPPGSPMVLVEEVVGWAAPTGGGLQRSSFERDGQPYTSVSVYLGFDEASWEPQRYERWVSDQLVNARAFYQTARREWQKAQANSPDESELRGHNDAG